MLTNLYVQYITGGFSSSSPINVFGSMDSSTNSADMATSFAQLVADVNFYCAWQVITSHCGLYFVDRFIL